MKTLLREMPKAELHRHLDGSVRFETIVQLAKYHNLDLGNEQELESKVKITEPLEDLNAVLETFSTTQKVLCCYDAIRRIAFENVEDAYRDGVRLLELRFAPAFIAEGKSLANDEIIEGVIDGISRGMDSYPIQVGLIGIAPRTFDLSINRSALDSLLRYKNSYHKNADRICGFDLAADEEGIDPQPFVPLVEQARNNGLGITIHSGENTNAEQVRITLDYFDPRRIGHGIKAWEDPEILQRLIRRDIILELCPTSNWLTRSVASLEDHPLPELFRSGVAICINSDDPHLMDIDLVHEYSICVDLFGLKTEELLEINRRTVKHSFLEPEIRNDAAKYFEP